MKLGDRYYINKNLPLLPQIDNCIMEGATLCKYCEYYFKNGAGTHLYSRQDLCNNCIKRNKGE